MRISDWSSDVCSSDLDVEQQAHRMHSYRPSSSSRASGDCRRSPSGGGVSLIRYGRIEWYWLQKCGMSTITSRHTARPGSGWSTMGSVRSRRVVVQTMQFLPLIVQYYKPTTTYRH